MVILIHITGCLDWQVVCSGLGLAGSGIAGAGMFSNAPTTIWFFIKPLRMLA